MITEAGIIGKIGFNSDGVGVCFNAIRAKGVDRSRIPVHLGLRLILESSSAEQAVQSREEGGMAAAAHILIADKNSFIGFEFSSSTTARLRPDSKERLIHSTVLSATPQTLQGAAASTSCFALLVRTAQPLLSEAARQGCQRRLRPRSTGRRSMRLCSRRRSDDLPLQVGGGSVAAQRIESVEKASKDREENVNGGSKDGSSGRIWCPLHGRRSQPHLHREI